MILCELRHWALRDRNLYLLDFPNSPSERVGHNHARSCHIRSSLPQTTAPTACLKSRRVESVRVTDWEEGRRMRVAWIGSVWGRDSGGRWRTLGQRTSQILSSRLQERHERGIGISQKPAQRELASERSCHLRHPRLHASCLGIYDQDTSHWRCSTRARTRFSKKTPHLADTLNTTKYVMNYDYDIWKPSTSIVRVRYSIVKESCTMGIASLWAIWEMRARGTVGA